MLILINHGYDIILSLSLFQTVGTVRIELDGDLDSVKFDLFLQNLLWENEIRTADGTSMEVLRMKVNNVRKIVVKLIPFPF